MNKNLFYSHFHPEIELSVPPKIKTNPELDSLKYNTKLFVIARSSQTTSDNEIIVLTSERSDAVKSRLTQLDSIPEEQVIILPGEIIDEKSIKSIKTKLSMDIK